MQYKLSNHIDSSAVIHRADSPHKGHPKHTSRVRTWTASLRNRDTDHVTAEYAQD